MGSNNQIKSQHQRLRFSGLLDKVRPPRKEIPRFSRAQLFKGKFRYILRSNKAEVTDQRNGVEDFCLTWDRTTFPTNSAQCNPRFVPHKQAAEPVGPAL